MKEEWREKIKYLAPSCWRFTVTDTTINWL